MGQGVGDGAWVVRVEMRGVHGDIPEGRARWLSGANKGKQGFNG